MKTRTLFQLGGIALVLNALLAYTGNLAYFLSGQPDHGTLLTLWLGLTSDILLVLGLGALFARQFQRGGVWGLVGYVSLISATLFFFGSGAVQLGIVSGPITDEQVAQVAAYAVPVAVIPWLWFAGLIIFGISIIRAQMFSTYAGILLIAHALLGQLTGLLPFTLLIWVIVAPFAWAWLGWTLLTDNRLIPREPIPAM